MIENSQGATLSISIDSEFNSFKKQLKMYKGLIFLRKYLIGGLIEKLRPEIVLIAIDIKSLFYQPIIISIQDESKPDFIVGFAMAFISRFNRQSVYLDAIAVHKDHRQKGYGKLLIKELQNELGEIKVNRCVCIYLKTFRYNNQKVLEFYKGLDFDKVKETRNKRYIKLKKKLTFTW